MTKGSARDKTVLIALGTLMVAGLVIVAVETGLGHTPSKATLVVVAVGIIVAAGLVAMLSRR